MATLYSTPNNMAASSMTNEQPTSPNENHTLQIDFSWGKFKSRIFEKNDPESKSLYILDYHCLSPHLVFKSTSDNSTIGIGKVHAISIDADCEVHGRPIKLKALKRFKTQYTHLSPAFSDTDTPVPMTWTSSSDFKTWDFICLDEHQNPVAKFSANIWALRKLGNIEFMGPKALNSAAAREEILVMGMTLYYCMAMRMNNPLSLLGAVFSSPGQLEKDKSTSGSELTEVGKKNK
ncbi:hypothetical protein LSUE1_G007152 [Lachnellula suecica]|uniref:Uncharacterized protein n=1 Tax=Lachnellula suecica TaxID=602035 RepID=A0A8T9C030_9HELO|nr:hypothetical protein LSUE1_G007152 [Lachnellula suecica]